MKETGPVLIAANHPNSFLDAVILASLFRKPIWSLARGDAFANNFYESILASLNMLPVYRLSEGAHNLGINYSTFDTCIELFKKDRIVLMFSEGGCVNEWHLRPLKKGTARLALAAWQQGIPLRVLPLGINYSSFRSFGKNMILNFGEWITQKDIAGGSEGQSIISFNNQLKEQLSRLVIEIDKNDKEKVQRVFFTSQPLLKKILLALPALAGIILHAPLYYLTKALIPARASDHYDSIMIGILFISYPLYIILLCFLACLLFHTAWGWLLVLVMPFTAWAALQEST